MAPKHSTEVLSNISQCRGPVMCITERICALAKLQSGTSSRAVDMGLSGGDNLKDAGLFRG